jgi:hypothetical protein
MIDFRKLVVDHLEDIFPLNSVDMKKQLDEWGWDMIYSIVKQIKDTLISTGGQMLLGEVCRRYNLNLRYEEIGPPTDGKTKERESIVGYVLENKIDFFFIFSCSLWTT